MGRYGSDPGDPWKDSVRARATRFISMMVPERSDASTRRTWERRPSLRSVEAGRRPIGSAGDEVLTEISTKFHRAGVEQDRAAAGMRLESFVADPAGRFGLALAAAP